MKALALALMLLAGAAAASTTTLPPSPAPVADPVRTVDRPYVRPQVVQDSGPGVVPAQQRPGARAPTAASFSLLVADVDLGRAFNRWARERRVSVRWLLGRDVPIDAGAEQVIPEPEDVQLATAQGSADPELVAAMVKVARAFSKSKYPFVVREYDNAIIIEPKSGSRQ